MMDFPWIDDVDVNDDFLNMYSAVPLILTVDLTKISEETGLAIKPYVLDTIEEDGVYETDNICDCFIFVSDDEMTLHGDVVKVIRRVHTSPSMPEHLTLPQGKFLRPRYIAHL